MHYLFLLLLLISGCGDIEHVFDSRIDYKDFPITIKSIHTNDEYWCRNASIQDSAVLGFGCKERNYLEKELDSIVLHESVKVQIEKFQ